MSGADNLAHRFQQSIASIGAPFRWGLRITLAVLLLVGAITIEQMASQNRQQDLFTLIPLAFDGFYGREESSTLPGLPLGELHSYHWARSASQFTFWPGSATNSVLDMQYLNPYGTVLLQVNQDIPLQLLESQSMRRLHMLLPASRGYTIQMLQLTPQTTDGRELGLIVGDLRWSSLRPRLQLGELWAARYVLWGLPSTLVLLALLGWVARWPEQRVLSLLFILLAVMALVAQQWPWEARAAQPTLQCFFVVASGAVVLGRLLQHRSITHWNRLIFGVWCLSLALFFSPGVSSDGVGYYAYLHSTFIDGDLNFSNEFDSNLSPFEHIPQRTPAPRPGYLVNSWSVGPAMFWTPFWLVAHEVVHFGQMLGIGWRGDGYDTPYIILIALASSLAGLATMLGCARIFARWFAPSSAALASITLYLGSNLFYYALFGGSFAHSFSAATATFFILACLRLDEHASLRRWLELGLATGALLVTYWIAALLLVVPLGIGVRLLTWCMRRRNLAGMVQSGIWALAAATVALLVFSPQLLAWKLTLNSWLAIPQGSAFATPQQSHILEMLVGPLYGLAWWTPAYMIGLVGSGWFALRRPWPGALLLLASVLYLLYNASLPDWHGSGAFGLRRLTALAPLWGIGVAALFDEVRRYRYVPAMLLATISAWSLVMTMRYVSYQLPHDPYTLRGVGLRSILLSQAPVSLDTLLNVVQHTWFPGLVYYRDAGNWLVAVVCLCIAIALWLLYTAYHNRIHADKAA